MPYRSVDDILEAAGGPGTRRALILTAIPPETAAVLSHLNTVVSTIAFGRTVCECGLFSSGGDDVLVVVAETGPGNFPAYGVALSAYFHFRGFDVQFFVGAGGSRKEHDAPLGTVVASSQVYWPYGGKYDERGLSTRPRGFASRQLLIGLANKVCRENQWQERILYPAEDGADPPDPVSGNPRPNALVAPVVSLEAVLADRDSPLEALIAATYGDAHVVEMEGYGASFAAHWNDTPSIVVRGISDLAHHEKSPVTDALRQPVAACHAAAFSFELLKHWTLAHPEVGQTDSGPPPDVAEEAAAAKATAVHPGSHRDDWTVLLAQLAAASAELLSWPATLPDGEQIERPELAPLVSRIEGASSSTTAVIGAPGAGKSALLATLAHRFMERDWPVLAIKGDLLDPSVSTEEKLQEHLGLDTPPSVLLRQLARSQPVLLVLDQLDALAGYLDLKTERLSVLLSMVRRLGAIENVHIVLSSRTFEFGHDVRLGAVSTDELSLELPPWEEVRAVLEARGVHAAGWPKDTKEVMRSPQALATYLPLKSEGALDAFRSYHDMLEHLWRTRILAPDGGARRARLATDIARAMARKESLWLPLVQYEDRLDDINVLESAGALITRKGSVGFTHQTVFEHVLARGFARGEGRLTRYVLERQSSLFLRPKLWVGLNYLRGVAQDAYHQELESIRTQPDLRDHLQLLLIDFLGSQSEPTDREAILMEQALRKSNHHRWQACRSMSGSPGWFARFRQTFIADAMRESDASAEAVTGVLVRAWAFAPDEVVALLRDNWLPDSRHDFRTWWVLQNAPHWSDTALAAACAIAGRSELDPHLVDHVVATVGVGQPEAALRLVHARLTRELATAGAESDRRAALPKPAFADIPEEVAWHIENDPRRPLETLIEASHGWDHLPALAERASARFLEILWPWFEECFGVTSAAGQIRWADLDYPLTMEVDFRFEQENDSRRSESPLLAGLRAAAERLAEIHPDEWLAWADRIGAFNAAPAQALVAHVYSLSPGRFSSHALAFLLEDTRRFTLGRTTGHTQTTERLATAASPHWTQDEVTAFEEAVRAYRPAVPGEVTTPEGRRQWNRMLRRTRLALLRALPKNRLDAKARRHVEEEERAFPDVGRPARVLGPAWIGPVMDAAAIARASDDAVINAFRTLPDASGWDHPKRFLMGGNVQLARAFAEFSEEDPERAIMLLARLGPENGTRAAGYALDAMARGAEPDLVLSLLHDVVARGFDGEEFRSSASNAVLQLVKRDARIEAPTIDLLESWLAESPQEAVAEAPAGAEEQEANEVGGQGEQDCTERSLLWGPGYDFLVPSGSFRTLEALVHVRRARQQYDQLDGMLERHLDRSKDPAFWEQVLLYLPSPDAANHAREAEFIKRLFAEVPSLVGSRIGARLLPKSLSWSADLAQIELDRWRDSDSPAARQAYGEIVAIAMLMRPDLEWPPDRIEELFRDEASEDARAGAALTAAHCWSSTTLRSAAGEVLTRLLDCDHPEIWTAACEVFRLVDTLSPDSPTISLLSQIERRPDGVPRSHAELMVECLGTLLPHEALLVARIARGLIRVWSEQLPDSRTSTALAAPALINVALTLHRLGPATKEIGTELFEQLLAIDALEARQALDELDNRFREQPARRRRRLPRRKRR